MVFSDVFGLLEPWTLAQGEFVLNNKQYMLHSVEGLTFFGADEVATHRHGVRLPKEASSLTMNFNVPSRVRWKNVIAIWIFSLTIRVVG